MPDTLDLKLFSHVVSAYQMEQPDEDRNKYLLEQYNSYLAMEDSLRAEFESGVARSINSSVKQLNHWVSTTKKSKEVV